jgi:hypothetical protein
MRNPTGLVSSKQAMTRPDSRPIAYGVYCGLLVGMCAWGGLAYLGLEVSRATAYSFPLLGGSFGAWVVERPSELRMWCGSLALLGGVAGFLGVLIGAAALDGRSLHVDQFAWTVSGPYGAVVGAMLGVAIWAVRRRGHHRKKGNPMWDRDLDT